MEAKVYLPSVNFNQTPIALPFNPDCSLKEVADEVARKVSHLLFTIHKIQY